MAHTEECNFESILIKFPSWLILHQKGASYSVVFELGRQNGGKLCLTEFRPFLKLKAIIAVFAETQQVDEISLGENLFVAENSPLILISLYSIPCSA